MRIGERSGGGVHIDHGHGKPSLRLVTREASTFDLRLRCVIGLRTSV
jgi:hypothetical protein